MSFLKPTNITMAITIILTSYYACLYPISIMVITYLFIMITYLFSLIKVSIKVRDYMGIFAAIPFFILVIIIAINAKFLFYTLPMYDKLLNSCEYKQEEIISDWSKIKEETNTLMNGIKT